MRSASDGSGDPSVRTWHRAEPDTPGPPSRHPRRWRGRCRLDWWRASGRGFVPLADGSQRIDRAPMKNGSTITPFAPGGLDDAACSRSPATAPGPVRPANQSRTVPEVGCERIASRCPSIACAGHDHGRVLDGLAVPEGAYDAGRGTGRDHGVRPTKSDAQCLGRAVGGTSGDHDPGGQTQLRRCLESQPTCRRTAR